MGREFYNQAVVKAYDSAGAFVCEEILPRERFDSDGSDLLISQERRVQHAIRSITVRTFDAAGKRNVNWKLQYTPDGTLLPQK